ncbi:MAG: GFA family protein [Gammaproteobacteria bacterium]|nr:GFA family protein [Gammaproteobacteria bacterium]
MITGSCLCGSVSWQVDGALENMTHCHCSMCRKAHAAPFATYVNAARDSFRWLSGEDAVAHYESSPGFIRAFCSNCGSVVPESSGNKRIAMPAGCLNEDPGVRPTAHIFAPSKAPWHTIEDNLQQFESYPEPDDGPVVERPGRGKGEVGVLRGSCLCGDVAYEIRTPIKFVHNCHCSRCRKARAAAHTTNGFTAIDGVVFVRGENKLKTYKLPSARFFTQTFCIRCGSGMPRLDADRGIAIIPFGSLDDDPGRGADDHIFTGSMAPWYTITDDLPCFKQAPG